MIVVVVRIEKLNMQLEGGYLGMRREVKGERDVDVK